MESIDDVIGANRALELTFDSRYRQLSAEDWSAYLHLRTFDENDEELDEEVAASAHLVRVNLDGPDWFDSLDAESGDLEAIGEAFVDRERIAELDENSLFASTLTIIDHIEVDPKHRGSQLSHSLVRGISHVFRDDIIALVPASMSASPDSKSGYGFDAEKQAGLRRHWAAAGFAQIPNTDVMLLPQRAR